MKTWTLWIMLKSQTTAGGAGMGIPMSGLMQDRRRRVMVWRLQSNRMAMIPLMRVGVIRQ